MKVSLIISAFLLLTSQVVLAQDFKAPSEGKALVYFVRYQGAMAVLDFKYFDGEKYLGKASLNNYILYECEPGEHIFWVSAENKEFIKGGLKPNSTYVIEVRPYMRVVSAGVELYQISPDDKKALRKIGLFMKRTDPTQFNPEDENLAEFIREGMERYQKIESKVTRLNPDWSF